MDKKSEYPQISTCVNTVWDACNTKAINVVTFWILQ